MSPSKAIEEALHAASRFVLDHFACPEGNWYDGEAQLLNKKLRDALAALNEVAVSGLTEEGRAEGRRLLAERKAATERLLEEPRNPSGSPHFGLSMLDDVARDALSDFLLSHAEALLSPAPPATAETDTLANQETKE